MADEKVFTIPLRREFLKVAKYRRTNKAVAAVRKFIARHMKVQEVKIGKELNLFLWAHGMKNPPSRVKVKSIKEEEHALVELPEAPFAFQKTKEEKKGLAEKILSKKGGKAEKKETPEEKKLDELKELKKEVAPAEMLKQKKEHKPQQVDVPENRLKQNEKVREQKQHMSNVIPESGRKEHSEPKP